MADFFGDLERLVADLYPYRWAITAVILVTLAVVAAVGYRRGWHMVVWRHRLPVAAVGTPVLVLAVVTGWYVVSPLFIDKRVDEEFPFALSAVVPAGMTRGEVEEVMEGMAKINQEMEEAMPASMMKLAGDDTMGGGTSGGVVKLGGEGTGSSQPSDDDAMEKPDEQPVAPETQPVAVRLKIGELKDADSFHKGSGQAIIYRGPDGSHLLRLENLSVTNGPDLHVLLSPHPDPQSSGEIKQPGYVDLGKLKGNKGNQNYEIPAEVDVSIQGSVIIYCKPFSVIFSVAPLQDVS